MKHHLGSVAGVLAGFLVLSAWVGYQINNNHTKPFENWIEYSKLEIPDYSQNENPTIVFVVQVKKSVNISWYSEVRNSENPDKSICKSHGYIEYKKGFASEYNKLDKIVTGCNLAPGSYFMTYESFISPFGYGSKTFLKTSNIFTVK